MSSNAEREWLRQLPRARLAYPETFGDRIKYFFWMVITPFHPHMRDLLCYLGILRNQGRQNYLLGKLAPHHTVETFVGFLLEKGFGNHFIAMEDDGQLVSLRYTEDFKYQYHIRVFHDGEVRGHFEFTPEYKPILHMKDVGVEARFEEFLMLLDGHIIPVPFSTKSDYTWSFLGR